MLAPIRTTKWLNKNEDGPSLDRNSPFALTLRLQDSNESRVLDAHALCNGTTLSSLPNMNGLVIPINSVPVPAKRNLGIPWFDVAIARAFAGRNHLVHLNYPL